MFLRSVIFLFVFAFAADAASQVDVVRRGYFTGTALVEGRDGALYGSQYPGKIVRYSRSGSFRVIHDLGREFFPHHFVAAADGQLYLTSAEYPALYRVSRSGVLEELWSSSGLASWPGSLVADLDDSVYGLAGNTVFRLSPDEVFSVVAVLSEFYPHRLFAGPDGALRVSGTSAQGEYAILRISSDGTVSNPITSGSLPGIVRALRRLPDGSMFGFAFLASPRPWDYSGRSFFRISPAGEIEHIAALPYSDLDGDGTFDQHGRFVFSEVEEGTDRWRFRSVALDGTTEILASLPRQSRLSLGYRGIVAMHDGTFYATANGPLVGQTVRPGALLRIWGAGPAKKTNVPPLARGDFLRAPKPGESAWISVLANDSDLNRDSLSLIEVSQPARGTVTADFERGRVRYTAPLGEPVIDDAFVYRIADSKGGTAVGRVAVRPKIRGSFAALIESEDPAKDGRIAITLRNSGVFTGHIWIGGRREAISGRLDEFNRFTFKQLGSVAVITALRIELRADTSNQLVIDVEIETPDASIELELSRPSLAAAGQLAGACTFALPSDPAWKEEPEYIGGYNVPLRQNPIFGVQGDGIGHLRLLKNGLATIAGNLPDGTPFTAGLVLDRAGRLPIFATFKARHSSPDEARKGWITGGLAFGDVPGLSDAAGSARWIQPWAKTFTSADSYFERAVDLVASRYAAPGSLQTEGWTRVQALAEGGGLSSTVSAPAQVTVNTLAGIPPLRANGNFAPATGFVSGHVSFPGWGAWTSYRGVLLQKQGRIVGQFRDLSKRGTGKLTLEPQ